MTITNSIIYQLTKSIEEHNIARLAVCAGRSPLSLFKELSECKHINWSKVLIIPTDERLVPLNHNHSNRLLLSTHFLQNYAENAQLLDLKKENLYQLPPYHVLDVVILGLGIDGHFASLFPEMIGIESAFNPAASPTILYTQPLGQPICQRVTMNLSMLLTSQTIALLVHGRDKNDVLMQANTSNKLPVSLLLQYGEDKLIIDRQ